MSEKEVITIIDRLIQLLKTIRNQSTNGSDALAALFKMVAKGADKKALADFEKKLKTNDFKSAPKKKKAVKTTTKVAKKAAKKATKKTTKKVAKKAAKKATKKTTKKVAKKVAKKATKKTAKKAPKKVAKKGLKKRKK